MEQFVSVEQIKNLDQKSIDLGHSLIQMMELAGYHLARFTTHRYPPQTHNNIFIYCGGGNNGGGGLVAAKHLANAGHNVSVFVASDNLKELPLKHLNTLKNINSNMITKNHDLEVAEVILDCIMGYGLEGDMKEETKQIINFVNSSGLPVVSLDIPSGVDPENAGVPFVAVQADHTVSLAANKKGLQNKQHAGVVHTYDIGIPKKAYEELGLAYPF